MIDPDDPLVAELRSVVQKIALISHAPIQGYNFAPSEVGKGERWRVSYTKAPIAHLGLHSAKGGDTQIPRGDVDHWGDFQVDYRQKSDLYFQRKFDRLQELERSTRDEVRALIKEAEQAYEDWQKTPEYRGEEQPARDSFRWKCLIADYGGDSLDDEDIKTINRLYAMSTQPVSRATIYRYRLKYRGLRFKA